MVATIRFLTILSLLGVSLLAADGARGRARAAPATGSSFPTSTAPDSLANQARYMVQQLTDFSQHYWARVAGRDTRLPPQVNGHDEFGAQWTREMLANLHGLPVGVFRQSFATPGFSGLPAKRLGANVVVAVPGSQHPDRAIVIGAHYDGEPTSKGSAYDDTSGCMILLGLARALGDMWRVQGLPSLTVEFVLFDAEEQGLIGSTAFVYAYRHGALMPSPQLMIDEEQSGAGYPARPFGLLSETPMPSFAITTEPHRLRVVGQPVTPDQAALARLQQRLTAARSSAFDQLHAVYSSLPYRGGDAPTFTPADERYLSVGPQWACCSDNVPFDETGVPTATLSGDFTYYERRNAWAFPFDQPQDTLQLLACDTGGNPRPGRTLQAALALPLDLSLQLVERYAPPASTQVAHAGRPIALFSTMPGANAGIRFVAVDASRAQWSFGDGATAAGSSVTHVYSRPGSYRLTIQAGTASGSWTLAVPEQQPVFQSRIRGIRPPAIVPWRPTKLQTIPGCH